MATHKLPQPTRRVCPGQPVLNELLAEVESYVTGAMHTFAEVPSPLRRADVDADDELSTLSANLREASREIRSIREAINRIIEAGKAGAA
jgi:hypothetical protein